MRCDTLRCDTDLHQDEEGREEQQGRPLDPGEHGLHVVPVGEQEQQERTQQRRPAQAQSAWKKKNNTALDWTLNDRQRTITVSFFQEKR